MFNSKNEVSLANENISKINKFYLEMLIFIDKDEQLRKDITHTLLVLKENETKEIILNNLKGIPGEDLPQVIENILRNLKYYVNQYWQEKHNCTKL